MRTIITLLVASLTLSFCQSRKPNLALKTNQVQKTNLTLQLEVGKSYNQTTNSKATIIQDIEGQEMTIEMIMKGNMSFLVKAVHSNVYDMEVKYNNMAMTMQLPEGTMEFSSDNKDKNDVFSSILSAMIDSPFQIKMTTQGKVMEIKNIDALIEAALAKFPEIPENERVQIKAQLMKAYGEEAFKSAFEMVMTIYPDKLVNKGDSWLIQTQLAPGLSADMITTYTYVEQTADYFLIVGDSKIKSNNTDVYIEANGFSVKYDLTGTMASKIKIDKITGWILEAKINQDMQGDVYFKENPQMPNGMTIPMVMKNELIFTDK